MNSFFEMRLNDNVFDYGTTGGPEFSTDIVELNNGSEQRNANWVEGRGRWDFGERTLRETELNTVQAFFRIVKGRAGGFRFKDWADYKVDVSNGLVGATGVGQGLKSLQLYKQYAAGGSTYLRKITKPVSGQVQLYRNNNPMTLGSNPGQYSVDTTTGLVSFVPDQQATITGMTNAASPCTINCATPHNMTTGQLVYLENLTGSFAALNGQSYQATVLNSTTLTIPVDTSSYNAFSGSGTVELYPQPADSLTWSGQFDVPVRFDVDKLPVEFKTAAVDPGANLVHEVFFYLHSVPLEEIRP